jgi:hypothetical protein
MQANLRVNASLGSGAGYNESIEGFKLTTAPDALRVLFLPTARYQRRCEENGAEHATVMHCLMPIKTAERKRLRMKQFGLWRVGFFSRRRALLTGLLWGGSG